MKEVILIMDEDYSYSKKFCNQAIKIFGKKYTFLAFPNFKSLREYANENEVESVIISDSFIENIDDLKVKSFYLLNEKDKNDRKEGKKTFIYKLQNIKNILSVVDNDISKKNEKAKRSEGNAKIALYYSPIFIKNKFEIVKRIAKQISKKKKVLIMDLDELNNYKGSVGLSNIIFNYKENNLNAESIKKEIIVDKELEFINSVTYPEDFSVVTNIDLANIVNDIIKLDYDYVFVNADLSFIKCQYILSDADSIILFKDKESEKVDKFKTYIKNENQIDFKKITEIDVSKIGKGYLLAFCKQYFDDKR